MADDRLANDTEFRSNFAALIDDVPRHPLDTGRVVRKMGASTFEEYLHDGLRVASGRFEDSQGLSKNARLPQDEFARNCCENTQKKAVTLNRTIPTPFVLPHRP